MDSQCTTPIVLIANGRYAQGLAATLRSIVQHTHPLPIINVIDAGLSEEDRRRTNEVPSCTHNACIYSFTAQPLQQVCRWPMSAG
jgi:lipopolysaccharide biosynthesis glycosyltransferase